MNVYKRYFPDYIENFGRIIGIICEKMTDKEKSCNDCGKVVKDEKKVINCTLCSLLTCLKHAKLTVKNEAICRKCYRATVLKKEVMKEYSEVVSRLMKEFKTVRHQRVVSKGKLGKKEATLVRLSTQLSVLKQIHSEKISSLQDRLKSTTASNSSLEKAIFSLKSAFSDIKKSQTLQQIELGSSLTSLESTSTTQIFLSQEVKNLEKLISNYQKSKKSCIHYNKIRMLFCPCCTDLIKKRFKKQLILNLSNHKSLISSLKSEKISVKSLPNPSSEACVCEII